VGMSLFLGARHCREAMSRPCKGTWGGGERRGGSLFLGALLSENNAPVPRGDPEGARTRGSATSWASLFLISGARHAANFVTPLLEPPLRLLLFFGMPPCLESNPPLEGVHVGGGGPHEFKLFKSPRGLAIGVGNVFFVKMPTTIAN
jgi:hypothetical protein